MIKLIKQAVKETKVEFTVGDIVQYTTESFDGRGYTTNTLIGEIIKVNKVTADVQLQSGNVYRVSKNELKVLHTVK